VARQRSLRGAIVALLVVGGLAVAPAAQAACNPPAPNAIAAENALPGAPSSQWDVTGSGSDSIQGFATEISVNCGDTVHFKVDTTASTYQIDIYRMGYYGGSGARKVATLPNVAGQSQGACDRQPSTGLVDCGNWAESASWAVPSNAVSGIYFAHLVSATGESHIFFVVRNDSSHSDLYYQTSDTTWQAYNQYGGNSLYTGTSNAATGRAVKVSYNRPFTTRSVDDGEDWVFNAEYPMVRWLERNGYDVSYSTGVDTDQRGGLITQHKTFLSVGHDEYWSAGQRANVEAARNAGVNLAFFSGNEVFWKTRWEDGHRTLVTYKETHAGEKIDPLAGTWTGTWRDPRPFNPEGAMPENALTGTLFTVNAGTAALVVPAEDGNLRLWRGTTVAGRPPGTSMTLTDGTLGYEWDEDVDDGVRPPGLVHLSSTTVDGVQKLQDYGSTYGAGTATHHLTLYRDTNGAGPDALVFGAGTVQWSWGLDGNHDRGNTVPSQAMQQATVNLMADLGAQPATRQGDLTAATASTDTVGPSTSITTPAADTRVPPGTSQISGTATDAGGGRVGGVEVSVDGGSTWHPATGRESWRYTWAPSVSGPVTLLSRAADDSANLGPETAVTVSVGNRGCPCSLFGDTQLGAAINDAEDVEVGVRFRADDDGFITALRYYRGAGAIGTRVGHLWTNTGTPLATVTFGGEAQLGWHEAALSAPVHVTSGATYVASYFVPGNTGGYSADPGFFDTPLDAAPLHAPATTNGMYAYGVGTQGGFPTQTFQATNYGADVVFVRADQTAPKVTAVAPADGAGAVDPGTPVTAAFDEPIDASTVAGATFQLRDGAGNLVPADVAYDAATRTAILRPKAALAGFVTYRATVKGGGAGIGDLAGNALAADRNWSFTTGLSLTGPTGGEVMSSNSGSGPGSGTGSSGSSAGAGPRVSPSARTLRMSKAGTVRLRIACPLKARSCRVQLRLRLGRRDIATKTLTVKGGKSTTVTLKLSSAARGDLRRKRSLQVTAIVTARDKAGHAATTRTPIRLLAPARR
jgi:N,N-dimethylformamidase beta subunit-like, C-terminal/Domain of unknown function (DUF4082)/Bacterial Ig-like domain/Bacterial Ig domain